ncbi:MAG: DciA family protein [Rhodospirillales bacterium]|jgi:hypothetical protein|nr:DciA family protein [Rhodospirillales bacterium]
MAKRGGGPRALAGALNKVTRPIFGKRGFAGGAVITEWPAIVGRHLAAHTVPERIAYQGGGRDRGILHLRVDSGALAAELQHLEPQLLDRINGYFGYRSVERLRIVHGPLPPAKAPPRPAPRALDRSEKKDLADRLAAIEDEDLRAALDALGRVVAASDKGQPKKNDV